VPEKEWVAGRDSGLLVMTPQVFGRNFRRMNISDSFSGQGGIRGLANYFAGKLASKELF
jgi:hypothetical protein